VEWSGVEQIVGVVSSDRVEHGRKPVVIWPCQTEKSAEESCSLARQSKVRQVRAQRIVRIDPVKLASAVMQNDVIHSKNRRQSLHSGICQFPSLRHYDGRVVLPASTSNWSFERFQVGQT
jgi:hypothetical protein